MPPSDDLLILLRAVLSAYAAFSIAKVLYGHRHDLRLFRAVWCRVRLRFVLDFLWLFPLVMLAGTVLSIVPWFSKGWMHLIYPTGGNVLLSPAMLAQGGELLPKIAGLAFLAVLVIAVPFIAHIEEDIFRRHTTTSRWHYHADSVGFGLIHSLLAGVPICVGLALSLVGYYYASVYGGAYRGIVARVGHEAAEEEALLVSTAAHTTYNTILLVMVATMIVW